MNIRHRRATDGMTAIVSYTPKEASELVGVSVSRIRSWIRVGLIRPTVDSEGRERLSFQEIVALRQARALSSRRGGGEDLRWLAAHARSGEGVSFNLDLAGETVVLRDERGIWRADSGQGVLELDAPAEAPDEPEEGGAQIIAWPGRTRSAESCVAEADGLERTSPQAAIAMYRQALEIDPDSCEAHVNLGRVLHEQREYVEAEQHYRAALALAPHNATVAYNLALLLEERGLPHDALTWYEAALVFDPGYVDAYFDAARMAEQVGRWQDALRYLVAYRRLTRGR